MAEAIIKDTGRIVPAAVWLTGQWDLKDIFVGAPVRLGRNGVEEIIEVELDGDERKLLVNSADAVREMVEALERIQSNA
jgi:malate dehydrogenase